MKKYILLITSILILAFVSFGQSEELNVISYSVSQSAGHFASDDIEDDQIPFDQEYSFLEDQFFQCKIVSVAGDNGLQLLVTNTDTDTAIINETEKNLTYLNQMKLPKGNYRIQILSHAEQATFDYSFSLKPFASLKLAKQEQYE